MLLLLSADLLGVQLVERKETSKEATIHKEKAVYIQGYKADTWSEVSGRLLEAYVTAVGDAKPNQITVGDTFGYVGYEPVWEDGGHVAAAFRVDRTGEEPVVTWHSRRMGFVRAIRVAEKGSTLPSHAGAIAEFAQAEAASSRHTSASAASAPATSAPAASATAASASVVDCSFS